jgi:site-specific recombinase XerD
MNTGGRSPKGLRHGFGVAAVTAGISLNLVQKWLGHTQFTTTAIYANAVGAEEKDIARRMWMVIVDGRGCNMPSQRDGSHPA